MKRIPILAVAVAAALSGCATGSRHDPLPDRALRALERRARSPESLDVSIRPDASGGLALTRTRQFTLGGATRLPLRNAGGAIVQPVASVRVNGTRLPLLVATASPRSLVTVRAAAECGVTPVRYAVPDQRAALLARSFAGPAGMVHAFPGVARSMTFGGLTVYNMVFDILDERRGLRRFPGLRKVPARAVLGHDFLQGFARLTLDYRNGVMRLHAGGQHRPDPHRLLGALPLHTSLGVPTVNALVNGRGPLPMALDTAGAEPVLWIPPRLAARTGLTSPAEDGGAAPGTASSLLPVADLDLSGFQLQGVPVRILPDGGDLPYALLGTPALGAYGVTLDFAAGKCYLERP